MENISIYIQSNTKEVGWAIGLYPHHVILSCLSCLCPVCDNIMNNEHVNGFKEEFIWLSGLSLNVDKIEIDYI